ncbi:MAG: hypothetical protein RXP92_02145 [Candidatus Micrarchaeota archaeon]
MRTESKFIIVAQELDGKLEEYKLFTSSSEDFKKALNDKFGGNINQFNQNLVFFALILADMEKATEKDEELKKSLPSLQEKMKAVNENIEKIAKELGYTVSQYSLDKLMGKNIEEVKNTLKNDFGGVEPKFEAIFSTNALNSLAELFAFTVNNYSGSVPSAFMLRDRNKPEENADKEEQKEKEQKEKEEHAQPILQQHAHAQPILKQAEQPILKQPASDENKQDEKYHSALREIGKKIGIAGAVVGALGAALFLGGFYYLPLAASGLLGIGLVSFGFPLLFIGGVTWVAGVINEAEHNDHISEAIKEHLVGVAGKIDEDIHKLANRVSKALNKEKKEQEEEQGEKQAAKGKQTNQTEEEKKQQGDQTWANWWERGISETERIQQLNNQD